MTVLVVVAVLVAVLGLGQSSGAGSSTVVVVSPADMQGWNFVLETGSTGTGQMVTGPASPPRGRGSARLTVSAIADGMVLVRRGWNGVRLDQITKLEYSTYRTSGASALAISLQFVIDDDVTDGDDSFKGRLVFEPYYTETVLTGQWQTWNPMTQGKWWGTRSPINTTCNIDRPCTWTEVLYHFPNAGIHNDSGAILFKAGSGWAGFDGNVDAFTIRVNDVETTYDFEPSGTIVIQKLTTGVGGTFSFTGTLGNFQLTTPSGGGTASRTFANVSPGTKTVTEQFVLDWVLINLVCSDPDGGTTVNVGTRTATIDLDGGETITCTFTNTQGVTLEGGGNCLQLNLQNQTYRFRTSTNVLFTGSLRVTRRGSVIQFSNLRMPGETWILGGTVNLIPGRGQAVLRTFFPRRTFSITDPNLSDNTCVP